MQRTLDLIANNHPDRASRAALFETVCRDCADNIHANLVSVWLFDGAKRRIVRRSVYDALIDDYEDDGMSIAFEQAPTYFRHLREETVIVAPDARNNQITFELTDFYFKPLGIVSLLDFIIHRPGADPYGVVCCENRHGRRDWSDADVSYLRTIVALAALHFS